MSDSSITVDEDFSSQLQALVAEAERSISSPAAQSHGGRPFGKSKPFPIEVPEPVEAPSDLLKELINKVRDLGAAQEDGSQAIKRIESKIEEREGMPKLLDDARQAIEQRNIVNKAMFDALHAELTGYKDLFMLDSVLRPVIRDMITLYDGTCELGRQMTTAIEEAGARGDRDGVLLEAMQTTSRNAEHHAHFIMEVLERLGVMQIPERAGKLDKLSQRVMAVEVAEDAGEDQLVVKVLKRGFTWRERVLRPEEVIIKKWPREGVAAANAEASG